MANRVYALLNVAYGKSEEIARALRGKPGVVLADPLEGPPDLILVVEAPERQKLVELTIDALASVETMTEALRLLDCRMDTL